MNKADFLKEYLAKQDREKAPAFVPPPPKGVTPEVVCPLCQGLGTLPHESRGEHEQNRTSYTGKTYRITVAFVTTSPERTCILCEGRRVILDRSSERPKAWSR